MGFTPAQFYALQYSELVLLLEGHRARQKQEARARREENAWVVSWLLLPHKGKDADPITPDQLMGRQPRRLRGKRQQKFASPIAAFDAFFAARSKCEVKVDA